MVRVFEAFSGVGTQHMALKRLSEDYSDFSFEVVGTSEIDEHAIKSYEAIHGNIRNYGDVSKIDVKDLPDFDLFTYSFPCQDISSAGVLGGLSKDSGTRSSLLWECLKIIKGKKPSFLLMENVKNLVGKRFISDFNEWLGVLGGLGYRSYWKVLNSKDYGVPQSRERVFCVSVLDEGGYVFPKTFKLQRSLRDILEDGVDEKYYIDDEKAANIKITKDGFKLGNISVAGYLPYSDGGGQHQSNMVYYRDGVAPTLSSADKSMPVKILENTIMDNNYPGSRPARFFGEVSPTLTTRGHLKVVEEGLRVRKLTPREYWRLMGISDEDFDKANEVVSNTQLYSQAGNAIVVDVLYYIFKNLFIY